MRAMNRHAVAAHIPGGQGAVGEGGDYAVDIVLAHGFGRATLPVGRAGSARCGLGTQILVGQGGCRYIGHFGIGAGAAPPRQAGMP